MTQLEKILCDCFSLLFPDDCRVCGTPLTEISRVPVCRRCLDAPVPFEAEHFCLACRTPFTNRHPLDENGRCLSCRLGLRGFDAAYCYGAYEGELKDLIHLFKYGRIPTLAGPLGRYLLMGLPREERFDVIVPVPLDWRRRWQRGFNQSELLAREVARRAGVPVVKALKRRRATAPQAGLSGAKRRTNVAGAFAAPRPAAVTGKRVLLVDDVMTTGSTASACAATLKRAGAAHVAVLTLARADRRRNSWAVPVVSGDGVSVRGNS